MNHPLVSIISPTYNHARFIQECIESVLNQTYPYWEMIIVDDGSVDDTRSIIQKYASMDGRIKHFFQGNKGIWRLAETYNFAATRTRGQLVAILEGDDFWLRNKLERQVEVFERHNDVYLAYGNTNFVHVDRDAELEYIQPFTESTYISHVQFMRSLLLRKNWVIPASLIFTRWALDRVGGFIQPKWPALDYPTLLQLSTIPGRVYYDTEMLACYRQHQSQVTSTHAMAMIEGRLDIALRFFESLPLETQKALQIHKRDIERAHNPYVIGMYLDLLRQSLVKKERGLSFRYARNLARHGGLKQKLQAIYGLCLSVPGMSMEHTFRLYELASAKLFK